MSDRLKISILIVLGVMLGVVVFYAVVGGSPIAVGAGSPAPDSYKPIAIENPALHLDRIERLRKLEYKPTGRNIFTAEAPKPLVVKREQSFPPPTGPQELPPPPPLTVPFKFYGFSENPGTKKRSGFFTNGEDVFIVAEGDTLQGKYRIVTITNTWADVEEISTSRRARLTMEGAAAGPQGDSPQG